MTNLLRRKGFIINPQKRADYKPPGVSEESKQRHDLRARIEEIDLQRDVDDDQAEGTCIRCRMLDAAEGSAYCHDCASDLARLAERQTSD